MGRRRRRHKHKNKQKPQPNNDQSKDQNKPQEDEAEIVEIATQAELDELMEIIMEHGAKRSERYHNKQKQLNNALLEDAGIPVPQEKLTEPTTASSDDSAI